MIEASKILTDQLMSGLERAVWWTEYVIRHNGTEHMRSPVIDQSIYEYIYLDVLLFLIVITALSCYVIYHLFIKHLVNSVNLYLCTKRI